MRLYPKNRIRRRCSGSLREFVFRFSATSFLGQQQKVQKLIEERNTYYAVNPGTNPVPEHVYRDIFENGASVFLRKSKIESNKFYLLIVADLDTAYTLRMKVIQEKYHTIKPNERIRELVDQG